MKIYSSDKVIAYLALISGLSISAVAVYYSVAGLVAIFAAAAIPIMIMGVVLELSKLVASVWLKQNWDRAPKGLKWYLTTAVVVLMIITSMGIFGFLSKAHLDQNLAGGDVVDRVAILDERIRTQKDNIEAARKALRQMDDAVDQTMARSTNEQGADKAAALRRSQQRERTNLQNDIAKAQSEIAKLNEERAPIAKDLRAVEAEVGPIKYIAKLIYGDNPDANLLEKAVTWVIMIIIFVFDPLAVLLLLASQYSFQWLRENKEDENEEMISDIYELENPPKEDNLEPIVEDKKPSDDPHPVGWMFPKVNTISGEATDPKHFGLDKIQDTLPVAEEQHNESIVDDDQEILDSAIETEKQAMTAWKQDHPNDSLKHQRRLLSQGVITELPWKRYLTAQLDTSDDEAAIEAARWAEEQLEAKKKDNNNLDGESGKDTSQKFQGPVGYVQNEEQSQSTIWQRVKNTKKDA